MWLRGKFNSSDLQSELKVGHTYEIEVVGYMVRVFSWYRNVLSVKEVSKQMDRFIINKYNKHILRRLTKIYNNMKLLFKVEKNLNYLNLK